MQIEDERNSLPAGASSSRARPKAKSAFVLGRALKGPGITACRRHLCGRPIGVVACIEIIDSRVENWKIQIQDTLAYANASSAFFVFGPREAQAFRHRPQARGHEARKKRPDRIDGSRERLALIHPVNAVAWLSPIALWQSWATGSLARRYRAFGRAYGPVVPFVEKATG